MTIHSDPIHVPVRPPRRSGSTTRYRILDVALREFNLFGEPNVTTSTLSARLDMSAGNLYYHYRNKDDIVAALLQRFDGESAQLMKFGGTRPDSIIALNDYLKAIFALIWRYRFLYRDLNELLSRHRKVELHFRALIDNQRAAVKTLCAILREEGALTASEVQIDALASNMVLVASFWLSFEYTRDARVYHEGGEPATVDGQGIATASGR